ncbi:MAG: M23 family metallopeptidase [Bacteroidota bacterium]
MKILQRLLIIFLILISLAQVDAQIIIPRDYFSSPLNIGLTVTGSFCEIRPNHFHSGTDFNVQKREGLPVFAVADGVVSRIKVSPVGFGNALYIDHPNGFTSVYAHLQRYNDTITDYLHTCQYKIKSFEVDLFPANKKEFINIKKGQLIGYAGNSGSSGGAHLHFELRDTKTERIINPLLFGMNIADFYPPVIDFIKIYPEDDNSFIGSKNDAIRFNVKRSGSNEYRLATKDTLTLWGKCSIGAQAFDFHQNQGDRNGFYSMKMYKDKALFFSMVCDSFAFDESRYVNACIDYSANYNDGERIVKSKKLPGNRLSFFETGTGNGILTFMDDKVHEVIICVGDLAGNTVSLRFWARSQKPDGFVQVPEIPLADTAVLFRYNKVNSFVTNELKVELPIGSLYEDLVFRYNKSPGSTAMFSDMHYLHDAEVPLQNRIRVSIKASELPSRLRAKALLMRIDRDGKRTPAGGAFENGYVTSTTNIFDGFAIVVDTIAPTIRPSADNKSSKTNLKFTVSDNFSGISTYRGELNGKWALVEWDPKNKLMKYTFDRLVQDGKNNFTLFLEDEKGNKTSFSTSFLR